MAERDLTKLPESYPDLLEGIASLIDESRSVAARSVNSIMTATYWEIGRQIVEVAQSRSERAEYGKQLVRNIAEGLKSRFGRGFSQRNLELMRRFYLAWPIAQTLSAQSQESHSANKSGSNPPVGLILCANKNDAVAHYAHDGLPNTVMASEYKLALPDEKLLVEELKRTQLAIDEMHATEENK